MTFTDEQIKKVSHIPTAEVAADLEDAKREINGYEVEMRAIESVGINATNKVRHYFLSAKVDKGRNFVSELSQILNHRNNNP